jgi:hypothetical protein
MYLRVTERRNRDGSAVVYYALAENVWNAQTKRSETQVIHTFGRADQLDKAALQRLIASIQRVIDADAAGTIATREKASLPDIEIDAVFELGIVLAARILWEDLGIGAAIRGCITEGDLSAPHEMALFAMAAQRLDDPGSKLGCATRWLPDIQGCSTLSTVDRILAACPATQGRIVSATRLVGFGAGRSSWLWYGNPTVRRLPCDRSTP